MSHVDGQVALPATNRKLAGLCRPPLSSIALLAAIAACDRPRTTPQPPAVTVRDSAGVEVVANHAPGWDEGGAWTVARTPEIVIGGYRDVIEVDSSHLVWKVGDVAPLSDGRVAVLSRGEKKVLLFESSGEFSRSVGRVGRGPGEFRNPDHLQVLAGDTLVVWDVSFGPVAWFAPSGRLLRERRIDAGSVFGATRKPNQMSAEGVYEPLADGSFIVMVGLVPGDFMPPFGEPYRVPVEFFRIDLDYSAYSLGRWEWVDVLYLQSPGPRVLPFHVGALLASGGTPVSVYVSNGDRYEVHQYSVTGVLRRILRRQVDPIPVTAGEIEEWKELQKVWSGRSEDWSSWDRAMAALPPRIRPPIAGLLVDSRGYLWVMDRYRLDRTASEWSVFDSAGHWLGTLEIPLGRVEWVGEDLILGVSQDPDTGVQVVEGYRLTR